MSQTRQDVIDLTQDTNSPPGSNTSPPLMTSEAPVAANRPPHFDRDIINLDDQEGSAIDLREESPEIQFLTSRPRSRIGRRGFAPAARSPIRNPQVAVRVSAGDRNPHQAAGWADALQNIQLPRPFHSNFGHASEDELVDVEGDLGMGIRRGFFRVPDNLNFLQAGFNYERPSQPQQQPRLPTYDPPPAAQLGFTRSAHEDDILVCPHCDDELGVGEDEVKRQVWVVKACGHVRVDPLLSCFTTNIAVGVLR